MVTALVLQLIQCSVNIEEMSNLALDDEVSPDMVKVRAMLVFMLNND